MWRFILIFLPVISFAQPSPPSRPRSAPPVRRPAPQVRPYYGGGFYYNDPFYRPGFSYHYHVVSPTYVRGEVIESLQVGDKVRAEGSDKSEARDKWTQACKDWKGELINAYDVVSDASCGVVKCSRENDKHVCESNGSATVRNK